MLNGCIGGDLWVLGACVVRASVRACVSESACVPVSWFLSVRVFGYCRCIVRS